MGIYCKNERSDLPAKICRNCTRSTSYYEGLDRENEIADTYVECCEYEAECPISCINWEEFIKEILKK